MTKHILSFLAFALTLAPSLAFASLPEPWQLGFQEPASPVFEELINFHNILLVIITAIVIFVAGLLAYVCIRFRRSANPVPSKTTHNTTLEIIWTAVPVLILVLIAVPSFRLLYHHNQVQDAEMTIKATGYQWYWGYEYPDHGGFSFLSYMVPETDLKEGQPRLLATDTEVVVPVDTKIRVLITANDVLHAWALPAFGVKKDAVPGRINEIWFKATKEGTYYGQCSELCGTGHGFMPITVRVVSKEEFANWIKWAQKEYASLETGKTLQLASK